MKKLISNLLCLFIISISSSLTAAENPFDNDFVDLLDNIDIANIKDNQLEKKDFNFNPGDLKPYLIIDFLKGLNLQSPLWKHTKAPVGRDILYLLPHKITSLEYGGIAGNFFVNMTDNMHASIDQFIAFDQINAISETLKMLMAQIKTSDLPSTIPLLQKVTVQERKAGILLQGALINGPFSIQLNTSLQVAERNLWLNLRDQHAIQYILEKDFPDFVLNNREGLVVAYGLGDTRLKVGLNTLNMHSLQVDFGLEAIFPTSNFASVPRVKVENLDIPIKDGNDLTSIAGKTLVAIRDYLLEPRIGNNNHFGFGTYMEAKIDLFHNAIQWWNRVSYNLLFEGNEARLIMDKPVIPLPQFWPGKIPEDQEPQFIRNYLSQYIFPSPYKVSIQPGGIINFVSSVSLDVNKNWRYALGYDFYLQGKEIIRSIIYPQVDMHKLQIEEAEADRVSQHKIYTELLYVKPQKHCVLNLGFGGDITVASKNIGRDWTIYFKLATAF